MNTMLRMEAKRRPYMAAAGLTLAAWTVLAAWSLSPYAEWLEHAEMEHLPAPPAVRVAVFALGWTLMIVAMMLPATLLLLARSQNGRDDLRRLLPVIAAYLAPWLVFGVFSYLGDSALHEIVEHNPAVAPLIAPGVLLLASVYQFTPLKRTCLAHCRNLGTLAVSEQTHGSGGWRLGFQHGLYCLGNCWALMLLMFAFGGASLLWMLALGAVMAAERLARSTVHLSPLLGGLLILAAAALVL